jgi:ubiquinone/menaquinone biosynthesis C-methylase UbiE
MEPEEVMGEPSRMSFFWDQYTDTTVGKYLTRIEIDFIHTLLQSFPHPQHILEYPCGSGRIARWLHDDLGLNTMGFDVDLTGVSALRQHTDRISIAIAEAHALPLPDESCDVITCIQALDYLDHLAFFKECRRILQNHGLLIMNFTNKASYKRLLRGLRSRSSDEDIFYKLNWREVNRILREHNFEVTCVIGYNWIPFGRLSTSKLVSVFAASERILNLRSLYTISPWVLCAARKMETL